MPSIAETVYAEITKKDYSCFSNEGMWSDHQHIVCKQGGIFVQETFNEEGMDSPYKEKIGLLYLFPDGSRINIVYGGRPVLLESVEPPPPAPDFPENEPDTIGRNGKRLKITSKTWWLSHALQKPDGSIAVARCYGKDFNGEVYLIDLTEEDLAQHQIHPGILQHPYVFEGSRPHTNRTEKPTSFEEYSRMMDALQNEESLYE